MRYVAQPRSRSFSQVHNPHADVRSKYQAQIFNSTVQFRPVFALQYEATACVTRPDMMYHCFCFICKSFSFCRSVCVSTFSARYPTICPYVTHSSPSTCQLAIYFSLTSPFLLYYSLPLATCLVLGPLQDLPSVLPNCHCSP